MLEMMTVMVEMMTLMVEMMTMMMEMMRMLMPAWRCSGGGSWVAATQVTEARGAFIILCAMPTLHFILYAMP